MGMILCPSMMCANYGNLKQEIHRLQDCGADIFHIDIMDGRFVPNFGMGLQDMEFICNNSKIKTEVHLMIEKPEEHIFRFIDLGADIIFIHPESTYHPMTLLQRIKEAGVETGIVINPGTSVETVFELLQVVNRVLVMGVNPGHAGQMYIPYVESKIDKLLLLKSQFNYVLGLDGACNMERISYFYQKGVTSFVLGTAALFKTEKKYEVTINELRKIESIIDRGGYSDIVGR